MGIDQDKLTKPWGFLPAEQYLIRNWDTASPLSPAAQRASLIKAFLAEDSIPASYAFAARDDTPSRIPTEDEIAIILTPWRPLKIRTIACMIWMSYRHDLIILRTCYGEEEDEKLREWLKIDEERYVFGGLEAGGWQGVLGLLPELVGRQGHGAGGVVRRALTQDDLDEVRGEREEEDWEDVIQYQAYSLSAPSPLLVADKQAFEEDRLRVLFLDAHGNIVKESDVAPEEMGEMMEDADSSRLETSKWWENGVVGGQYLTDGELGRLLFSGAA
ncbi:hypothetical protein B0T22DRAFT_481350 [Podospora appendiculata]|uniref:Uncharacterized protein n=1 Tax=Podospora appendiculata TaxID=314037 RepID=A0AAE0XCM1_9PEZI|nr:hypothetical protein B0T22DRAFT_481350 [Podospora appendiculata]